MAYLTILDYAALKGAGSAEMQMAQSILRNAPFLANLPFREGNGLTHTASRQTAEATITPRNMNEAAASVKNTYVPVAYKAALYSETSFVDLHQYKSASNPDEYRAAEDLNILAAIGRAFNAGCYYYDSSLNPKEFDGLGVYANALNSDNATDDPIVIGAGGSGGSETSAYAVKFGPGYVEGFYAPGGAPLPEVIDMGVQNAFDSNGNSFPAMATSFVWNAGLIVNPAAVGRVANIESSTNILDFDALNELVTAMVVEPDAIFLNGRGAKQLLDLKTGTAGQIGTGEGSIVTPVTDYHGIPVYIDHQITNTEATVS